MNAAVLKAGSINTVLCSLLGAELTGDPSTQPLHLENQHMRVQLDEKALGVTLISKASGRTWQSAQPCFALSVGDKQIEAGLQVTCNHIGSRLRIGVRTWAKDHGGKPAAIELGIYLRGNRATFVVATTEPLAEGTKLEVEFPRELGRARASEGGYLVLPFAPGALCPFDATRESRTLECFYGGGQYWAMPIFGVVKSRRGLQGDGLCAVANTPYDCKFRTWMNRGKDSVYAVSPSWVFEGKRLDYPREMDVFLLANATYVEIAKTYRRELIRGHRFVALLTKSKGEPYIQRLAGAVTGQQPVRIRQSEVAEDLGTGSAQRLLDYAHGAGFDRVLAFLAGPWERASRGGMNPAYGSEQDLRRATEYARSLSKGFVVSVYDNFIDLYPSAPDYDETLFARNPDGSPQHNWYSSTTRQWAGRVCSSLRVRRAEKELPRLARLIGKGSLYLDVEGASPLFECFDSRHPLTRGEDAENRRRLLRLARRIFGSVATEGLPSDFLADVVDLGAYFGAPWGPGVRPPLVPAPLFFLVYHDSVLGMTPAGGGGSYYPPHVPLYGLLPSTFDEKGLRVSYMMRDTAYAEMVEHRFLTGPAVREGPCRPDDVQLSRFSDGTTVVANFTPRPFQYKGTRVPAENFVIFKEELRVEMKFDGQPRAGTRTRVSVQLTNRGSARLSVLSCALRPQPALTDRVHLKPASASHTLCLDPGRRAGILFDAYFARAAIDHPLVLVTSVDYAYRGKRRRATEVLEAHIAPPVAPAFRIAGSLDERTLTVTLRNNTSAPAHGSIKVQVSEGWRLQALSPASFTISGMQREAEKRFLLSRSDPTQLSESRLLVTIDHDTGCSDTLRSVAEIIMDKDLMAAVNSSFEEGLTWWGVWGDWDTRNVTIDEAVARKGRASARIASTTDSDQYLATSCGTGIRPLGAIRFSAWSRARGLARAANGQYGLMLNLFTAEQTAWITQESGNFEPREHDWQERTIVYDGAIGKLVTGIAPHLMFRRQDGTAWFDDVSVTCDGIIRATTWFKKGRGVPDAWHQLSP